MTRKECEECKVLVEEAKVKCQNSGEWVYCQVCSGENEHCANNEATVNIMAVNNVKILYTNATSLTSGT